MIKEPVVQRGSGRPTEPALATEGPILTTGAELASVRYIVDDVPAVTDFYTRHLGFTVQSSAGEAFADVVRGSLRLLLSGSASSGARATPDAYSAPGRNRIHLVLDDFDGDIDRLHAAEVPFRSEVVSGPGGRQVLVADPAGNLIELFEPGRRALRQRCISACRGCCRSWRRWRRTAIGPVHGAELYAARLISIRARTAGGRLCRHHASQTEIGGASSRRR